MPKMSGGEFQNQAKLRRQDLNPRPSGYESARGSTGGSSADSDLCDGI